LAGAMGFWLELMIPYWTIANLIESHLQSSKGGLKTSTGQEAQPHGSTGIDDFTGDRHNMSGQAIQLNDLMTSEEMSE